MHPSAFKGLLGTTNDTNPKSHSDDRTPRAVVELVFIISAIFEIIWKGDEFVLQ